MLLSLGEGEHAVPLPPLYPTVCDLLTYWRQNERGQKRSGSVAWCIGKGDVCLAILGYENDLVSKTPSLAEPGELLHWSLGCGWEGQPWNPFLFLQLPHPLFLCWDHMKLSKAASGLSRCFPSCPIPSSSSILRDWIVCVAERQLSSSTLDGLDNLKQCVLFWGYCKRRHSSWWKILGCVVAQGVPPCPLSGQLWEVMLQWGNGSGRQTENQITVMGRGICSQLTDA